MSEIYVGNLSFNLNEHELEEFFKSYGDVKRVKLITDRHTGRSKGFAFVEFGSQAEADAAIEATNGKELGGRSLRVSIPRQRDDEGGRGGRGGRGGFGGRGDRGDRSWND